MNEKKSLIKGKTSSLMSKYIGLLLFILLLVLRIYQGNEITISYVFACGLAGIIAANIFISVDISLWIQNFKKGKEILNNEINREN